MIVLRGFSQWFAPHRREAFTQCAKGRPGEIRSKMHVNNTTHTSKPRGQSLIEFALLLPLLLVLIVSAIEFGRLFYTKIVITNAAREGAYYYATNPSEYTLTDLEDQAELAARAEAANSGVSVNEVEFAPTGSGMFSKIEVTVSATVQDLIILNFLDSVFSIFGGNQDITLSSTVEMMVQ
jgi:Flp pilus assembly protein TadG